MYFFPEVDNEVFGPQPNEKREGNDVEKDNDSKHQEPGKFKSTIASTP